MTLLDRYAQAPDEVQEDLKQQTLLILKNGDEIVEMLYAPAEEGRNALGQITWSIEPGDLIEAASGDITHIIWETPTGCMETWVNIKKGNSVEVTKPKKGQPQTGATWSPCN